MSEQHTPEPWGISHDNHDGWPLVMAGGQIVANVNAESFSGGVAHLIDMPAESNARRIVACVNACDGISQQYLEELNGETLVDKQLELIRQRDELRAALERAETAMEICSDWMTEIEMPDGWTTVADEKLRISAAIASEKGGAS